MQWYSTRCPLTDGALLTSDESGVTKIVDIETFSHEASQGHWMEK